VSGGRVGPSKLGGSPFSVTSVGMAFCASNFPLFFSFYQFVFYLTRSCMFTFIDCSWYIIFLSYFTVMFLFLCIISNLKKNNGAFN
jgi:hypothetical protein